MLVKVQKEMWNGEELTDMRNESNAHETGFGIVINHRYT
jgi:hypothetical protein